MLGRERKTLWFTIGFIIVSSRGRKEEARKFVSFMKGNLLNIDITFTIVLFGHGKLLLTSAIFFGSGAFTGFFMLSNCCGKEGKKGMTELCLIQFY